MRDLPNNADRGRSVDDALHSFAERQGLLDEDAATQVSDLICNLLHYCDLARLDPLPVADRGPDTVLNGLALSRTVHWLFDRGYLSLGDDYSILRASGCPEDVGHILHPSGQAIVPANDADKPHPAFLRWHRENKFKAS